MIHEHQLFQIPTLETNIIFTCNLRCEYCTHLGRYMTGHYCVEEIGSWFATWSRKVLPEKLSILGGEPLLHPELGKVLEISRTYWPNSEIQMVTNGLLFEKVTGAIFDTMKKNDIFVSISKQFDTEKYTRTIQEFSGILKEHDIRHEIRPSYQWWLKSYRIMETDQILPYRSSPEKAWNACFVKNKCATIMDNKIYKCPQLACFGNAYRKGILTNQWKVLESYRPLEPTCTESEIRMFFETGAVQECCICPEVFEYANHEEKSNVKQ